MMSVDTAEDIQQWTELVIDYIAMFERLILLDIKIFRIEIRCTIQRHDILLLLRYTQII